MVQRLAAYRGYSPLLTHTFRVIISDLPEGVNMDKLDFNLTATSMPGQEIEAVIANVGHGYTLQFPGKATQPSWTTSLWINDNNEGVDKALRTWSRLCFNPVTGESSSKGEIGAMGEVQMLGKNLEVARKAILHHIWPLTISEIALDRSGSEAARMEITWSADGVEHIDT